MTIINKSNVYDISSYIQEVQRKYVDDEVTDDTLALGMFGYLNEVFSLTLQNAIINANEWGNEAFPIRSKFDKSVLTNANTYGVTNINAVPSSMKIMLGFIEKDIDRIMGNRNKFIVDSTNVFRIGDFDFHLDYDIIINKDVLEDGSKVYSAIYDMDIPNNISKITNPYLQAPIKLVVDNSQFIFILCDIRQINSTVQYEKILSGNMLDNKTFDFEFNDELCDFMITVEHSGSVDIIKPLYEGTPTNGIKDFCYFYYMDRNTIRIKFDRNGYNPKINSDINILIKTTKGDKGNFIYKDDIILNLKSDKYLYNNINCLLRPISDAVGGMNMKTIDQLKEIIPKEILARGSIINDKDIENFFNNIDINNKMLFYKRRDNQIERLYYAYLLLKDSSDDIIPTNTINLRLSKEDLTEYDDRLRLEPGCMIEYDGDVGTIIKCDNIVEKEKNGFLYSLPYTMMINKKPFSTSYYLDQIDKAYDLKYNTINLQSEIQFICNTLQVSKNYLIDNKYRFCVNLLQNVNVDKNMCIFDHDGNIIDTLIIPLISFVKNGYRYYREGKIISVDRKSFSYDVEFEIEPDVIDSENNIRLNGIIPQGGTEETYAFIPGEIDMEVVVYLKNGYMETYDIKTLNGLTMANKYTTVDKVNLFYNYSHILNSKLILNRDNSFTIEGVPLVRYSYCNDISKNSELIDYIQYRKSYIDEALIILENSFGVDMKFFNTYGPSKTFQIGHNNEMIDKVNISLTFKLKPKYGASEDVKDFVISYIRDSIENINNIEDIHMSNLITDITTVFRDDIEFIEFCNINEYNSLYQYLKRTQRDLLKDVPEFINVNLNENYEPDINIIIV